MTAKDLRCVLVVEDDDDIRESIIMILKDEGYFVESACNGKEALEKLQTCKQPCLILLDMMMPIMNGKEFLKNISANVRLAPIPIIVVSAIANEENAKGATGFIKKPLNIDSILNVVHTYCTHC